MKYIIKNNILGKIRIEKERRNYKK